ncbi:MAG: VWA domain-containing protein [Pyrinomonadaceae bacterium]
MALSLFVTAVSAQRNPTTANGREVKIRLSAVDNNGKQVDTLKAEDVRIVEDGVAQSITGFNRITQQSLSLAMLIDTSWSQETTLGGQQFAAKFFLTSTITPGRDQAAVVTFTDSLAVEQNLTDDLPKLQTAVDRARVIVPPGYARGGIVFGPLPPASKGTPLPGATAIWDAILGACGRVWPPSKFDTRKAIILLTDGEDTHSKAKMSEAIEAAVRNDVVIYAVGIGDPKSYGVNKEALRRVSESTGGQAFFPKLVGDLTRVFAQIREALRNQYVVSYASTNAKPSRKLRIGIVSPSLKDVQLFYQKTVSTQP